MPGWRAYEVRPEVEARIARGPPACAPSLESELDALWEAAQTRTGGVLFNGQVFSVDRIAPELLSGHFTEFRRIVAQMERPRLYDALRVRPLAVCGVVCCREGVVIGRRPARAVYQPSMWQLPPAGSVDAGALLPHGRLDLSGQLFRELREELGLPAASIIESRPLCLVEHPGSHVLDLGFLLRTPLPAEAVLAAHALDGNGEYHDLEVVPFDALAVRVEELGEHLVPPARVFLQKLGWLNSADS
jgi:8-oxo-dGTP pyrophosphatase MutT (NUDIX family)